jgi:hypothetical protein
MRHGLATHIVNRRTADEARRALKAQQPDAEEQPV